MYETMIKNAKKPAKKYVTFSNILFLDSCLAWAAANSSKESLSIVTVKVGAK